VLHRFHNLKETERQETSHEVAHNTETEQSKFASDHQLDWGSLITLQIKNRVTSTTHNHIKGDIDLINVDAKRAG
jgi:hypothetical protein